jgi:hypothetical protein
MTVHPDRLPDSNPPLMTAAVDSDVTRSNNPSAATATWRELISSVMGERINGLLYELFGRLRRAKNGAPEATNGK